MKLGVDVSEYNGTIDWPTVAKHKDFALIRVSIGTGFDATGLDNLPAAKRAGLTAYAYHYLLPGDPVAQASIFRSASMSAQMALLDVEQVGLTFADVQRFAKAYAPPLTIFTGRGFWASREFGDPDGSTIGPLWHSEYPNVLPTPLDSAPEWHPGYGGWNEALFWQYTDKGVVPGIVHPCDLDAFRGPVLPGESVILTANSTATTNHLAEVSKGTQLFDVSGQPLVQYSADYTIVLVGPGSGAFDFTIVTHNGVLQYALVRTADLRNKRPVQSTDTATLQAKIAAAQAALA